MQMWIAPNYNAIPVVCWLAETATSTMKQDTTGEAYTSIQPQIGGIDRISLFPIRHRYSVTLFPSDTISLINSLNSAKPIGNYLC
jgi:hypothetical protein